MLEEVVRTFIRMDFMLMSYWESVAQCQAVVIREHLCVKLFLLTPEKQLSFHPDIVFVLDKLIS